MSSISFTVLLELEQSFLDACTEAVILEEVELRRGKYRNKINYHKPKLSNRRSQHHTHQANLDTRYTTHGH